ncbi:hypothetical protein [Anaerovorax sp. IOR16]|uniref:hypothetical protein n=1 Tax=Anaerovorax sp. IOR16 TaxID=2773458 RepID=UPI0019CFE8F3|nr:hypothetical protein [Anaerovorax sp. IOR16]
MLTVKMTAQSMREMMGEAFDFEVYEKGRQDARKLYYDHPEEIKSKVEEVTRRIESGEFRHTPGPSYWIGCLCEFNFMPSQPLQH